MIPLLKPHRKIHFKLVIMKPIKISVFGMETFARDEEDISAAIEELLTCFFIASEKFGKGIKEELRLAINDSK
jgi:hypothetical protein